MHPVKTTGPVDPDMRGAGFVQAAWAVSFLSRMPRQCPFTRLSGPPTSSRALPRPKCQRASHTLCTI